MAYGDEQLREKVKDVPPQTRQIPGGTTRAGPMVRTKRRRIEKSSNIPKTGSVLDLKTGLADPSIYHPKSAVSAGIYKEILSILQLVLVGESSDTLYEAAHETIKIMRTDATETFRKGRLTSVLSVASISDDMYTSLLRLCSMIQDFESETMGDKSAETGGIAVTFDEAEEENQSESELSLDEDFQKTQEVQLVIEAEEEPSQTKALNPNEIPWSQFQDGFWLRRELVHTGYSEDEVIELEESMKTLLTPANLANHSLIENKLFQIFKFKNLQLCKLISHNKYKIWLSLGMIKEPSVGNQLVSQLLEFTDTRASELFKEISASQQRVGTRLDESLGYPQPSTLLDLSNLIFEQGGRLMSNPSFTPETKTYQESKPNYDEVHVEPPEKVQVKATDLVNVRHSMPEWSHAAFSGFETLNPIQSKVFPIAFGEFKENIMMCAPTGAGKTNVAMLTIMNVLGQYWNESKGSFDSSQFKVVYIAPMKALVQEVVKSFSLRLNPLGINVRELSGDSNLSREQVADTQVIVTTPEKWDVVTRKSGESRSYTHLVRLVIIDEVHLLHDSRGPVLEAIVARTHRQIEQSQEYVRIVALSATLPNYRDVALFLRVNLDKGLFYFGSEYRPVPLQQTYIGITSNKGLKRAQVTNECVFEKVMDEVGQNQILVFVHGRKETVKTARSLVELATQKKELEKFLPEDSASKGILQHEASSTIKTSDLKELLPYGIGVHHAGLPQLDRSTVEDLFAGRHLSVVVCTLTLAWGVNLPAHTVIIKGTQIYMPEKGDWVELSPMDMFQMMGRAGRPQYDTSGHGIVITNKSELQYYLSLNNMQLPIESQLISVLPDMINAEMALGTITSRTEAAKWISYTYLHVRMTQNPGLYGVAVDEAESDPKLIQRRVDLAHAALTVLDKNGLCKYDRRSGQAQITALGRVASYFYLRHDSVAVYNQHLKPGMSDIELLRLFSLSREFKYIPVREEEKVELMKLVEMVPIPIKGGAEDSCSKINVLLQAYISRLSLEGFALLSDMVFVTQSAGRLFRALFEIAIKRGWSVLARRCLNWCKIVELRMWPIQTVLRHFKSVPEDICRKIEKKGISNEEFSILSSTDIGEIVRNPKLGKTIHVLLSQIPKIEVTAYVQPVSRSTLVVKIDVQPDYDYDPSVHVENEYFWVFIEDVSQQHCLYSDQFSVRSWQVKAKTVQTLTFTVPVTEPLPPFYFVRVISDKWMGSETVRPISFRHLYLPDKCLPPTELLDMDPRPVESLEFEKAATILKSQYGISHLNPIQTQTFSALYESDDNVLLCAPMSSGKGVSILCSIFRMINKFSKKCIYVSPNENLVASRFHEWRPVFTQLGLSIDALTGEPSQDIKILEASDLVLSTPFQWDLISRKWRTKRSRRVFENIGLFIADNLHLVDMERDGSVMELIVSRMRYIAASIEKENKIRLIGVGSSVANAQDLGSWIGAVHVFNFAPHTRSIPLEIAIHGSDIYSRQVRQLSLLRPLYTSIVNKAGSQPALVFCTDRRQCRIAAADLVLQAMADGTPFKFLNCDESVLRQYTNGIRETALVQALEHGIGYIHGGMTANESSNVKSLFSAGAIQVLFVSYELLWGLSLKAFLVVILDTNVYSTSERQLVDYKAVEVLEMLGTAGRYGIDSTAKCILFCANSKREYYKKFINEPVPVESVLDEAIGDYMNAEISNGTIKSRQESIDWLTWTLFYRRITKNPNYYSLESTSQQAISDFLSGIVEDSVESLLQSGMIVEEDILVAGDLGLIASYYNVRTATVEMLRRSITALTKRKQLIEILCQSEEFSFLSLNPDESPLLIQIASTLKLGLHESQFSNNRGLVGDPHVKALVLLYSHFNRVPLTTDLQAELNLILPIAHRLVQAMVDIVSTCGWLKVALAAMEIAPMIVQGILPSASPLLQLPHFDLERCEQAASSFEVEDIVDILSMSDGDRDALLSGLDNGQISEVARACNMFPSINISTSTHREGDDIMVEIKLDREGDLVLDKRGTFVPVFAPMYPKEKEEGWWVMIGNSGSVEDLKRITISQQSEIVKMRISNPSEGGYKLVLMSDSFIGCDQEESLVL